eukprot:gene2181-2498_t
MALQLLAADAQGAGAFREATSSGYPAADPASNPDGDPASNPGGGGSGGSSSLAAAVGRCLSAVAAQDPSAAHQALAAQADALLQRVLSLCQVERASKAWQAGY